MDTLLSHRNIINCDNHNYLYVYCVVLSYFTAILRAGNFTMQCVLCVEMFLNF